MLGHSVKKAIDLTKPSFLQELDTSNVLKALWERFDRSEETEILSHTDTDRQCSIFLDILKDKPVAVFDEFCQYLSDRGKSHLLLEMMTHNVKFEESGETESLNTPASSSSQSNGAIADTVLKEQARLQADNQTLKEQARLQAENQSLREELERLRLQEDREDSLDRSFEMNGYEQYDRPEKVGLIESEIIDTGTDKVIWETHRVTLHRVPNFGFGIAVSGGRDNPHFTNGDPSIAISDIIKAGPAEGKLSINDRVVTVNGQSFEDINHNAAIEFLKNCGNMIDLVVKRKILVPNPFECQPTKVLLQKKNKKDDYGIILGCKFYVKEIVGNCLAALDGGIKEGDTILKLNNMSVDSLSLIEARRQLEKSRDKLLVTLKKPPRAPSVTNLLHKRQNSDLDYTKYPQSKSDNMYLSAVQHEKPDYDKPSINSFVKPKTAEQYLSPYRVPDQVASHYRTPQFNHSHTGETARLNGNLPLGSETRNIVFSKEGGGAGMRIAGGNHIGIFVAGVQDSSPAYNEGVREGDEIVKIGGTSVRGLTREDAVLMVMNIEGRVALTVQNKIDFFRQHLTSSGTDSGDLFYMKAHMNYEAPKGSNHLSISQGDIFKVTDTLRGGVVGEWAVFKLNSNNEEVEAGVIPSKARAEVLRNPNRDTERSEKRGSIFRRKTQRRTKSLGRDHWDDVIFVGADDPQEKSKHPAYQRVLLKETPFRRPVIIYGGIADICRDKLLKEYSDVFAIPHLERDAQEDDKYQSGIFKLSSIQSVINGGKHCLLDVTPGAVDKLNYAQYYPIVLNIHADKKDVVKDIRTKYTKTSKNTKKLLEQAEKIEKTYPYIFTATMTLHSHTDWYKELLDMIHREQSQPIWMTEKKPADYNQDDVLFPMANRLSLAASPEQETDLTQSYHAQHDLTYGHGLHRATSDPNLEGEELAPPLPSYSASRPTFYGAIDNPAHHPPPDAPYARAGYRVPKRDRFASDSRVPHSHSVAPITNGFASLDRSAHKKSSRRSRENHSGAESDGEYLSRSQSTYDPYRVNRTTSTPHQQVPPPGYIKSRPQPPIRSDSMSFPQRPSDPRIPENPYARSRTTSGSESAHRRLHHTTSVDTPNRARGYDDDGTYRRPHAIPSSNPNYPTITPPGYYQSGPYAAHSRHRHTSTPHRLQHSQSAIESVVVHATPVSMSSSFNNQLYMDSSDAQNATTPTSPVGPQSFENYKEIGSKKPFYKSQSQREIRNPSAANGQSEPPSAFESYKQNSSSLERETTPENHTVLDSVSGTYTSSGGVLSSVATGISIHIPPNAIPHGVQQELYFKVCQQDSSVLQNALDADNKETTLSPLVLCGPHGLKFQVPVELRLPNSMKGGQNDWNFSVKRSANENKENQWESINISEMQSNARANNGCVIVHVDNF